MRDSAQVTAPGAIASMIVAVSTRPNGQNRSTCSRMSVPSVQKQKLRLVNRINWGTRRSHLMTARMVNAIATANTNLAGFDFGFGAMFPSWLQYRTFRGANREKWVSHFTLRMIIILMETIKDLYQTRLARGR